MKTLIILFASFLLTIALSAVGFAATSAPAVVKSNGFVSSAPPIAPPSAYAEALRPANSPPLGGGIKSTTTQSNVKASGVQTITGVGFVWDHCQQTWRALGDNKTWCYLESNTTWIWTNDSIVQNMMLDAAASDHWFGINVNSFSGGSFTFDYAILWKY
jgi:hypothetical protein